MGMTVQIGGGGSGTNFWSALSSTQLRPDVAQGYTSVDLSTTGVYSWNAADTTMARLAAASIRFGGAPSASPVAQTFTLGEASRPSTDTNVGGSSGTMRSGLGTGTGTASSLIFQTSTVVGSGSSVQTYTTRLTLSAASALFTVPVIGPAGGATSVVFGFNNSANLGFYNSTGAIIRLVNGSTDGVVFDATNSGLYCEAAGNLYSAVGSYATYGFRNAAGRFFGWSASTTDATAAADTVIGRVAALSVRIGFDPSGSPAANVLTVGESSRGGTDSNVVGGNGTIQCGAGTGVSAVRSLIFNTPDAAASGSTQQSYSAKLTLSQGGAVLGTNVQQKAGTNTAAANDLTLDLTGNCYQITGATQINRLSITGWQAGSVVHLWFASTPTVKNNQSPSGAFQAILLNSGSDFTAAANSTLSLMYNGTSWLEVGRKA